MKRIFRLHFIAAAILLLILFAADLLTGSAGIAPGEVWDILSGSPADTNSSLIIWNIRLPKALTAMIAGAAVSLSGLLMQTLFMNPLAGPYVLGISSGASLGAALCVLGVSSGMTAGMAPLLENLGIAGAAWAGAAIVLAVIMAASRKIGDNTVLLVLGMMLGAGIDSVVLILQYLSDEQALKSYIVWTMGSLGNISGARLWIMAGTVLAGAAVAGALCKPLNLLLTGENYAASAGTDVRQTRSLVFAATVLLAGTVTAFCGPVGFIGLAVPHLARMIFASADHRILVPGSMMAGAALLLVCDLVSKSLALPINTITALMGIPVVIFVVIRNRNLF